MTTQYDKFDYYYDAQIRRYTNQFAQVFSGMYVTIGKNDVISDDNFIKVPIVIGSADRVVLAIKSENTQNKLVRVPMFSIKLDSISIDMDRKVGTGTEYRQTVFPVGGDIKTDLRAVYRTKPLPYNFTFSVAAFTSNTDHMNQIIEQILMLFDPLLQFQTSDARYDYTKIVDAQMVSLNLDDNRNSDTDNRVLVTTFGFEVRLYMAPPANIKNNIIKSIRLRVEAIAGAYNTEEYVADSTRPLPEYTEIYNLDNEDIPPN
jgi:T4-like virus Myoviridae tail sheath stabiliser